MFRLWAKEFKDNRMVKDTVIEDGREETRTHKVFDALEEVCLQFDLGSRSGWKAPSPSLNGTARRVFIRIIL